MRSPPSTRTGGLLAVVLLVATPFLSPALPLAPGAPLRAQQPDSTPLDALEALPGRDSEPPSVVRPEDAAPRLRGAVESDGGEPPVPVLLVPGWSDGPEDLEPLQTRFLEAGWPFGHVMMVEFEDPVGSNWAHAETVSAAVRSLRAATGASEVDVVAHSMGGLAVRRLLAGAGSAGGSVADSAADSIRVRRVVFLGTPHRGTAAAWLAWGEGGDEMEPGSRFLETLNAGPFVPERVEALAVRTPLDLRVIPGESARLPEADNTRNVEICCPTHPGLLDHDETFRAVVEFLRDGG